jgi:hypothetical protein
MKFNKILCTALAAIALTVAPAALAQFDTFRSTAGVVLAAPGPLIPSAGVNNYTNGWVDLVGYAGTGDITIISSTNAGGTLTVTLENTADTNTPAQLANFALIKAETTALITNLYYTTNYVVQDSFLLPYSATTPTAATAGFATPYPNYISGQLAFTNVAGAITITRADIYKVGINLTDSQRYIRAIWTATGAATNGQTVVGAVLNGNRAFRPTGN